LEEGELEEEGETEDTEDTEESEDGGDAESKRKRRGSGDVVVIRQPTRKRRNFVDAIDVDVDIVKVPPGKWRVVVRHVPAGRFVFARLAVGFEIRQSMINPYKQEVTDRSEGAEDDNVNSEPSTAEEYEAKKTYKKQKVRPGLNVFNEKGQELDWDYEHDTRFYDDPAVSQPSVAVEEPNTEPVEEEIVVADGRTIRSRGRGTKKFIAALLDSDSE